MPDLNLYAHVFVQASTGGCVDITADGCTGAAHSKQAAAG